MKNETYDQLTEIEIELGKYIYECEESGIDVAKVKNIRAKLNKILDDNLLILEEDGN